MTETFALELSLFDRAIARLDEIVGAFESSPNDINRDAVIMRFMFTYELGVKTLQRFLEETSASPEITNTSFQTLIRRADDRGLLRNGWPGWSKYREARNQVAHTYNEDRAIGVAAVAADFADEARFLLASLKEKARD